MARLSCYNTEGRPSFSEHLPQIANQNFRDFMCCKVPALFILCSKHPIFVYTPAVVIDA